MMRWAMILISSVALCWGGAAMADIPPPKKPAPLPAPKPTPTPKPTPKPAAPEEAPDDPVKAPEDGGEKPGGGEGSPGEAGADEAVGPDEGGDVAPRRIELAPGPPDGTFGGTLATPAGDVQVALVVVGGLLVHGEARLPDGRTLALEAAGELDSPHLRLGVRDGREFLRVKVELFDDERGRGEFNGVLGKKRLEGQWTAERR